MTESCDYCGKKFNNDENNALEYDSSDHGFIVPVFKLCSKRCYDKMEDSYKPRKKQNSYKPRRKQNIIMKLLKRAIL